MPRETSECEDAAIDRIATAASWPWNLSTVPTGDVGQAGVVEGAAQLADLAVVGRDDDDVGWRAAVAARPGRRRSRAPCGSCQVRPSRSCTRSRTTSASSGDHVELSWWSTRRTCRPGSTPSSCRAAVTDVLGAQLAGVRQPRDGLGEGRVHAPGRLEEVAELGRQHRLVADQPAERGRVDGVGVGALRHLRQLLGVAEQQQPVAGHRAGEGLREGELPGLVDDDEVELAAADPLGAGEVPGGAADDVAPAGAHVPGGELGEVVGLGQGGPGGALGVAGGLADLLGRAPRRRRRRAGRSRSPCAPAR